MLTRSMSAHNAGRLIAGRGLVTQRCQGAEFAEIDGSTLPDAGRYCLKTVRSRYERAAENRLPRRESGFCQFCPSFRAYGLTATRGNLCRLPPHSHSIVAGGLPEMS
jgi:hypothetical protein